MRKLFKGYVAYSIATLIGWLGFWYFINNNSPYATSYVTLYLMTCAYLQGAYEQQRKGL